MDKIKASQFADLAYYSRQNPLIPELYQQVEYLQSSGTQCIVTSVPMDRYVETHCTGQFVGSNGAWVSLVGGRNASTGSGRYIVLGLSDSQNLRVSYGEGQVLCNRSGYTLNKIVFNDASHKVYLNDAQVANFSNYPLTITGQQNIALFGMTGYDGSNVGYKASGQIYSVSFYNNTNDELLGDLIPCYRKADSKPGMYDIVTNTFLTNSGTGEFTVGGNV